MAHDLLVKLDATAMLRAGDKVTRIARKLGIPKQTVSRWKLAADRRKIIKLELSPQEWQEVAAMLFEMPRSSGGTEKV